MKNKINVFYSDQEIKLFKDLGWGYLFENTFVDNPIEPFVMYRMASESAFINNSQGNAVEALRKGMKAMSESKPYRFTPEFEKLIDY